MPKWCFLSLILSMFALSACAHTSSMCDQQNIQKQYLTVPPEELPNSTPSLQETPVLVEINGREIAVDKVVSGALCNDSWSGTVYVTCDVQVYPWVDAPLFLKECNLDIAPGTVVYVAYHNNTAYYKGCSCHTGEIDQP